MDGIVHVAGVGPAMTLGGKEYPFKAYSGKERALLEAKILGTRFNPLNWFETAVLPKDPAVLRVLAEAAFSASTSQGMVTEEDINRYATTLEGSMYVTWLFIRHNDAALTFEKFSEVFHAEVEKVLSEGGPAALETWKKNLFKMADLVEGRADLKNASDLPASTAAEVKTTTA